MSDEAVRIRLESGVDVPAAEATAVLVLDVHAHVVGASDPALESIGPSVIGRPFTDLLSPGDREYWVAAPQVGPPERFEGLFLYPAGSEDENPRLLVTSAERREGEPGWLLSARAPTPDDLRVARALRAARFEIVGRIASGVAHELNNILSTVTTFSDLLRARVENDASMAEDLKEIKDAATEASHVLRKLDLFAGGRAKGPDRVHVQDVLAGMEKLLRRFVPQGVDVRVEIPTDCPPVHVDPLRLEEALFALLADACDAVSAGGRVRITATPAAGDEAAAGPHVRLTVERTDGAKPDPPTSPASARDGMSDHGSGLGRSYVHRFAVASGGRLGSEHGASGVARAWLELPIHADPTTASGG